MHSYAASQKLNELLDANARFDVSARGTTNHCPMALIALAEMGASPGRLQEFFDIWEKKYALIAPPIGEFIAREKWLEHLGTQASFGALRICFGDWIAHAGPAYVIGAVLKEVPFAPATAAFHSLIRLSYGIEAAHTGEIASGLASLISSYLPIDGCLDEGHVACSVDDGFSYTAAALSGIALPRNSITARLLAVTKDVRFGAAVLSPPAQSSLLDDIARTTIAAYWRKPDFTILHTVTATRAARILFAMLSDILIEQSLQKFWIALCIAYATVEIPAGIIVQSPDLDVGWNDVCRMAIASNDDHVIKMTYTCLCEDRRDPSSLYLASAARLVS